VVVDVLDADAVALAVAAARPDIIIHQLTDLPSAPGTPGYPAAQEANRRLRIEGTANLMRAAQRAGVRRAIAQSIAFVYAPGEGTRSEEDPLDMAVEGVRQQTVQGIAALEREVLGTPGIAGVVLRYGYLYGPDTWYAAPPKSPSVHVEAAAHGVARGKPWRRDLQHRRGRRRRVDRQGRARPRLRSGVQDQLIGGVAT